MWGIILQQESVDEHGALVLNRQIKKLKRQSQDILVYAKARDSPSKSSEGISLLSVVFTQEEFPESGAAVHRHEPLPGVSRTFKHVGSGVQAGQHTVASPRHGSSNK